MDNEKWQDQIEDYLDGKLSGKELKDFETDLKNNNDLQERLSLSQSVEKAFQNERLEKAFRPNLKALGQQYVLSKNQPTNEAVSDSQKKDDAASAGSSKNRRHFFLLLIAIVSVVGLYTAFKLVNTTEEKTANQIFATHFNPIAPNEINRGESVTETDDYKNAIEAYQAQNYAVALVAFETKHASSPDDVFNSLLLSNVYLSLNQSEKAIELLQPLASDNTHLFTKETQWYLALAYLQLEKPTLALPLLEKLSSQENGKYVQLSTDLLEDLR